MNTHWQSGTTLFSPRRTVAGKLLISLSVIAGVVSAQSPQTKSTTSDSNATEAGQGNGDLANPTPKPQGVTVFVTTPRAGLPILETVAVTRSRTWMLASERTIDEDIKVVARDLKNGQALFEMNWRPLRGKSLAISDDESLMACCDGHSRQLIVCDFKTQRVVCTCPLPNQESPLERIQMEFSPDGKNLLLVHLRHPCFRTRVNGTILTLLSVPDGKVEDTQAMFQCGRLLSRVANSKSYLLAGRFGIRQVDISTGRIEMQRRLTLDQQNRMLKEPRSKESPSDRILALPPGDFLQISVASDGSKMAYIQANYEVIDAVGKSRHVGNSLRIWDFATGQVVAETSFGSEFSLDQSKFELYFSPIDSPELEIMRRSAQEYLLPRLGVSNSLNVNPSP